MGRLTADPDQRLGAIDLVEDLGCEPMALAQASGVIATSSLSCRDYQGYFTSRQDELAATAGSKPPAAAVSWLFSVEQADRLAQGGAAQPVLVQPPRLIISRRERLLARPPSARPRTHSRGDNPPVSRQIRTKRPEDAAREPGVRARCRM